MDGGWLPSVEFGFAKVHAETPHGCAAMDGGWLPSVEFGFAKLQKQKWHGCHFCAAQAIAAEILFAGGKKIGADSAVFAEQKCAQNVKRTTGN
jgi:hypothetical protein